MTAEQVILWEKIRNFELDDPTIPLTFTDRLARENGWTHEYTLLFRHMVKIGYQNAKSESETSHLKLNTLNLTL